MDSIKLSNGLKIKCKSLEKAEYETITKDGAGKPIAKFKELYNIDVHQLTNGQVVVNENDYYTLYFSLEDLDAVLQDATGAAEGVEMMQHINVYGEAFPAQTTDLIKQLLSLLHMEYTSPTPALLNEIDAKINQLEDPQSFREDNLISFVALLGELFINKDQAEWRMELASDGVTWNPYMLVRGEPVQFFGYLYEDIFINQSNYDQLLSEVYETVNEIIKQNIK